MHNHAMLFTARHWFRAASWVPLPGSPIQPLPTRAREAAEQGRLPCSAQTRSMQPIGTRLARRNAIVLAALTAVKPLPSGAVSSFTLGPTASGALRPCPKLQPAEQGCASTLAESSPSRYVSPLRYEGLSREQAFRRVRSYLAARDDTTILEDTPEYLHAQLSNRGSDEPDDLELKFLPDESIIAVRCIAQRTKPMQPLCVARGCINGNQQWRRRIEQLRDDNGFTSDEDGNRYELEKDWVPIFFH